MGQGGWMHRQEAAQHRQGPEMSSKPPTDTGTVRKALWKQLVDQRPVDTHTGPGMFTPVQVRYIGPAPGPYLHTQAAPAGEAIRVTLVPTKLEGMLPQALEVVTPERVIHR